MTEYASAGKRHAALSAINRKIKRVKILEYFILFDMCDSSFLDIFLLSQKPEM